MYILYVYNNEHQQRNVNKLRECRSKDCNLPVRCPYPYKVTLELYVYSFF